MLLTQAQIEEFQAEGALLLQSFIPPDVLQTWREQVHAACAADEPPVDLTDPSTFPNGRYAPEGGWPELEPNVYDLPTLQELVQQLGGGAFAPSHPAGMPWSPQVPMTRVIMPDAEDAEEWAPPPNGHLDGYAAGWGGGFMVFMVRTLRYPSRLKPYPGTVAARRRCCWRTSTRRRVAAPPTGPAPTSRTTATSSPTRTSLMAHTSTRSPSSLAGTARSWRAIRRWGR